MKGLQIWAKFARILNFNQFKHIEQHFQVYLNVIPVFVDKVMKRLYNTGCLIMKEVKYEPRAQSKMHLYKLRQVAKVQLVGNILIFIQLLSSNHIFVYLIHMPAKWAKFEKQEKYIEKINNFDRPYGFCSHFHTFCPLWL